MGRHGNNENIKNRQAVHQSNSYSILDIEIDTVNDLEACSSGLCDVSEREIPLYKYSEIPSFLQGNPYVVSGYRVSLPFNLCLKSIFKWNNETINVWSHLGGFLLFLYLVLHDNIIYIPRFGGSFTDHIIVTLGLICYQFCMLCSAGFHMFSCHSEKASKRWLAVDLTGISIGVIGCYLPAVHYAFYCLSIWRDIYLITITLLTVITMVIQLHPRYFSHRWSNYRILIYVGLVGYGVIPTIHWIWLNGGASSEIVQIFVPKITTMYLLGMAALFLYITKFPERFYPGVFDFIGSSHQWWHIIVVGAFVFWHYAGQEILKYRVAHPCHS